MYIQLDFFSLCLHLSSPTPILPTNVYHLPTYGYDLEGLSRHKTDFDYFD